MNSHPIMSTTMRLLRDYRIIVAILIFIAGLILVVLNQSGHAALATPLKPEIIALTDLNSSRSMPGSKQGTPPAHPPYDGFSDPLQQIEFLQARLNENPNDEVALMGLGNVSLMIRRFNDAAPIYERLPELNPAHVEARINLASIKLEQGDAEEARSLLEKILSFLPMMRPRYSI